MNKTRLKIGTKSVAFKCLNRELETVSILEAKYKRRQNKYFLNLIATIGFLQILKKMRAQNKFDFHQRNNISLQTQKLL